MIGGAAQNVGGGVGIGTVTLTVFATGFVAPEPALFKGGGPPGDHWLAICAANIGGTPHATTITIAITARNLMTHFHTPMNLKLMDGQGHEYCSGLPRLWPGTPVPSKPVQLLNWIDF